MCPFYSKIPSPHGHAFGLFRKKSSACPDCTFAALCKIAPKKIAALRTAIYCLEFFNDFEKSRACPNFLSKTNFRREGFCCSVCVVFSAFLAKSKQCYVCFDCSKLFQNWRPHTKNYRNLKFCLETIFLVRNSLRQHVLTLLSPCILHITSQMLWYNTLDVKTCFHVFSSFNKCYCRVFDFWKKFFYCQKVKRVNWTYSE